MKRVNGIAVWFAAGAMVCSAVPMYAAAAQETPAAQNTTPSAAPGQQSATDADAAAAHSWTTEQLVPLSVREAWHLSGKNEQNFFEMVKQLAELSAQKRGITLPDDKAAGEKAGEWIKKQAKKDPDQLLYVVVDRAVQYSARPTTQK
jgi:hypothetical protein